MARQAGLGRQRHGDGSHRGRSPGPAEAFADDPLFGMWRDREDMADVAGYVRKLRASRFNDDGTRREG